MRYILAIDQGRASSRSNIFDREGCAVSVGQMEYTQYYPKSDLVEHDAEEIWASQIVTAVQAVAKANLTSADITTVGITIQRETTIIWDRKTGKPIHNAIRLAGSPNIRYM